MASIAGPLPAPSRPALCRGENRRDGCHKVKLAQRAGSSLEPAQQRFLALEPSPRWHWRAANPQVGSGGNEQVHSHTHSTSCWVWCGGCSWVWCGGCCSELKRFPPLCWAVCELGTPRPCNAMPCTCTTLPPAGGGQGAAAALCCAAGARAAGARHPALPASQPRLALQLRAVRAAGGHAAAQAAAVAAAAGAALHDALPLDARCAPGRSVLPRCALCNAVACSDALLHCLCF